MSDGWGRTKNPDGTLAASYSVPPAANGYGRYLQAMMRGAGSQTVQGQVEMMRRFSDTRSSKAPWSTRRR